VREVRVRLEHLKGALTDVLKVKVAALVRQELATARPQEQSKMLEISSVGEELVEPPVRQVQVKLLSEIAQAVVVGKLTQPAYRVSTRYRLELRLDLREDLVADAPSPPLLAQLLKEVEWRTAHGRAPGVAACATAASCRAGQVPL